jgi:CRP-like cAMP-binding protein
MMREPITRSGLQTCDSLRFRTFALSQPFNLNNPTPGRWPWRPGSARPDPIALKISQETLAEMIGTSRTHVNFFMNKFRQLGLVEYNGDIKVNRSLLNMLLHEKPQIVSRD